MIHSHLPLLASRRRAPGAAAHGRAPLAVGLAAPFAAALCALFLLLAPIPASAQLYSANIQSYSTNDFLDATDTTLQVTVRNTGGPGCIHVEVLSFPADWTVTSAQANDGVCAFSSGTGAYPRVTRRMLTNESKTFAFTVRPVNYVTTGKITWRLSGTFMNEFAEVLSDNNQQTVRTVFPPGSFTTFSPVSNEALDHITPTFTWQPASDTTSYQVNLFDDSGGTPAPTPRYESPALTQNTLDYSGPALNWGTTYWWEVIARNAWATTKNSNGKVRFNINPPPTPGPFNIVNPVHNQQYTAAPLVTWSYSNNAVHYLVFVYDDVNGAPAATPRYSSGPNTQFYLDLAPLNLPFGKHYWVQIIAVSSTQYPVGATNSPVRFYLSRLYPFTLQFPFSGERSAPLQPSFSWTPALNAQQYRLEIYGAPDTIDEYFKLTFNTTLTNYTYTGPLLKAQSLYNWRVFAINGTEELVSSPAAEWFITLPVQPFCLLTPYANARGIPDRPTFTWQDASGATQFRLDLSVYQAGVPDNKLLVYQSGWLSAFEPRSHTPSLFQPLQRGQKHYWRVFADTRDAGGRYNEGGWQEFTVTSTQPFSLLTPGNGALIDAGPVNFTWDIPINAERSTLALFHANADGNPYGNPIAIIDTQKAATHNFSGPPLLTGQSRYAWQVLAWQGDNFTAAANGPFLFTTRSSPAVNAQIIREAILGLGNPDSTAQPFIDSPPDGAVDAADLIRWIR